jgi:hypothetical protein
LAIGYWLCSALAIALRFSSADIAERPSMSSSAARSSSALPDSSSPACWSAAVARMFARTVGSGSRWACASRSAAVVDQLVAGDLLQVVCLLLKLVQGGLHVVMDAHLRRLLGRRWCAWCGFGGTARSGSSTAVVSNSGWRELLGSGAPLLLVARQVRNTTGATAFAAGDAIVAGAVVVSDEPCVSDRNSGPVENHW